MMAKQKSSDNALVSELSKLLASSYTLLIKTHNYHWNVEGPYFYSAHKLLDEQYHEIFDAIDTIAEHIRSLGHYAPGSLKEFSELSEIGDGQARQGEAMLKELADDNDRLAEQANALARQAGEKGDESTNDVAVDRARAHQKAAWMLHALAS